MKQRARRYFTQAEMTEVWDRWESGESLNSIARGLERGHSAIQGMLSSTGGVRQVAADLDVYSGPGIDPKRTLRRKYLPEVTNPTIRPSIVNLRII